MRVVQQLRISGYVQTLRTYPGTFYPDIRIPCYPYTCKRSLKDTWRSGSSAFLNGNRLCPLFLLKYSFRRAMLQLEFQESKSKLEQSHLSQRNRRYAVCIVEVTMYGRLPFKKLGFLAVQLWPIFLQKYSLRRAMLQLEFG